MRNWFKKDDPKLLKFHQQLDEFKALQLDKRFKPDELEINPYLDDATKDTSFDAHYVYHPAWAARILKEINPERHVDISSTLHFCSMLSAFIKTEFYDYRPARLNLNNLECLEADLTHLFFESNSIQSLSCMHTIEHIGLGRYGDPIDPYGDYKAIKELKRVCAAGGSLLLVVPVGHRKVIFNAHRIYNPIDIVEQMTGFELKSFVLIDDQSNYIENATLADAALQHYGCGCYWFVKQK